MATSFELRLPHPEDEPAPLYRVVHPLDDEPEAKCDPDALGPMHMSRSVKASLFVLRLYLIVMVALVGYRVLELAGVVHLA